ncbi:MAG: hypothetical protein ACM3X7_07315 [Solirubrobacterales bacterium]
MQGKTKKYIFILLAMVLVLIALIVGENNVQHIEESVLGVYSMRGACSYQFMIYSITGMIFGFEKFLDERKKCGSWRIDNYKLLIIGLPSFLIGIFNVMFYTFNFFPPIINLVLINHGQFISFMQMVFGYVIITSFYKDKEITS